MIQNIVGKRRLACVPPLAIALLAGCSGSVPGSAGARQPADSRDAAFRKAGVHSVARDRDVWQQLLTDHSKIRRTVVHREESGVGIVEATTESDDPAVAARIIDHAEAMEVRMGVGAKVRVWDPVFSELFERHDKVKISVTTTPKGVRIVESSTDPEAIALMRAHAIGVSEFVREGHAAGGRETPHFPAGAPLPPPEVVLGGVKHRFLLVQPDGAQVALLKAQGVDRFVSYRKPSEHGNYDEQSAAAAANATYCGIPYKEASELTDEVLARSCDEYRTSAQQGTVLALHCRTGNRVGPGWAAYLALDRGIAVDEAIASAKAVGMVDPMYESITRDYIRRGLAARGGADASWHLIEEPQLTEAQRAQRDAAAAARTEMFSRLFAALGEAMDKPGSDGRPAGAAGAISVCKEQAPKIAQSVARERGVMIGRTSDKLRNAANIAPAWAEPLLLDHPAGARFVASTDGSLGVTLPIKLTANCLACHGAPEQINPATRDALAATYANDRATGYSEGDVRGWFWVEVPPTRP